MDQALGELHHGAVVAEGLVDLHRGELGIVAAVDAFVAEVAVDLIDPAHAADEAALEVELGRDPHEERHVERVVMRRERPRGGAACDRLQDRRLDLEVAARIHEAADARHDARAHREDLRGLGVRVHVDIAAPVAELGVGQSVPLRRRRRKRLRAERHRRRPHAHLALVRAADRTFGHEDVAVVDMLRELERLRRHRRLRHAHLEVAGRVAQEEEHELAHVAVLHHAACDLDLRAPIRHRGRRTRGLRFLRRRLVGDMRVLAEAGTRVGKRQKPVLALSVRLEAEFVAEALQLRAARRDDLGFGKRSGFLRGRLGHSPQS